VKQLRLQDGPGLLRPVALHGDVGTVWRMASTQQPTPQRSARSAKKSENYVVVFEFARGNGVEVVEVAASSRKEARSQAMARVLDGDDDDCGSDIRRTWVVHGTLT
jgi:hypothetical protein